MAKKFALLVSRRPNASTPSIRYYIPKLSDCYRREAQKRLASHEVGVIFATQSYPTDTVKKRNRETIDAVVSSKP